MEKNCLQVYFQSKVICFTLCNPPGTLINFSNYNSFYTVNSSFKKTKL